QVSVPGMVRAQEPEEIAHQWLNLRGKVLDIVLAADSADSACMARRPRAVEIDQHGRELDLAVGVDAPGPLRAVLHNRHQAWPRAEVEIQEARHRLGDFTALQLLQELRERAFGLDL